MFMTGAFNIVKMAIAPKEIHRFTMIPIKIPMVFFFFFRNGNLILKFMWYCKGTRIAQMALKK